MKNDPLLNLDLWKVFIAAASSRSFHEAGGKLRLDATSVGRKIAKLEEGLGFPLFSREGKEPSLTDKGRTALDHARQLLYVSGKTIEEMKEGVPMPGQKLHILASTGFSNVFLRRAITLFSESHPECSFVHETLSSSESYFERLGKGVDLIVTAYKADIPGVAMRVVSCHKKLCCASPGFVQRHGLLKHPDDLRPFSLAGNAHFLQGISFRQKKTGATYKGELSFKILSDNSLLLADWAAAGNGIFVGCPATLASEYIRDGRLKVILQDWELPKLRGYAYTSLADSKSPDSLVIQFIDVMAYAGREITRLAL
ncbi:LysR family transcriptional regulator [Mesosutterella sp. OilRF-GAM-744-9]|uniref:LysR family transcriptional regulator n=1 Tax=Mesosutterella porci TaxID=2915351 RepID=A0ABS9MNF2_9BURK|nr:LysR family transcriptional regulator [Mesosutterella sp. oilRF-744-WT-GAM-9]MCG5030149.1 LysR family transcriptional regulator [Mesosutterella sp. oilRF-744-WT-GAM-9]